MKSTKMIALIPVVALMVGFASETAFAKEYPRRPITMICPWGAGGGTDAVSRILATLLKPELGVPVNVVNRTGGSGAVGHTVMATAKPNGYTIGMATYEVTMMHWMGLTNITYEDLTPVAMVNIDPAAINVRADSPWKTYQDLLEYVKANPGQLKCSGTGMGGSWHLAMAGWLKAAGLDARAVKWIPSKGAAPALQDLLAGGIQLSTCSLPEAATLIEAGKVRPLAVMAEERDPKFPDLPTLKELGPDWTCGAWRGVAAPKDTPPEIVAMLEKALGKIVKSEAFIKFMQNRGYGIYWKEAKAFAKILADSDATNGRLMKDAGIIQ